MDRRHLLKLSKAVPKEFRDIISWLKYGHPTETNRSIHWRSVWPVSKGLQSLQYEYLSNSVSVSHPHSRCLSLSLSPFTSCTGQCKATTTEQVLKFNTHRQIYWLSCGLETLSGCSFNGECMDTRSSLAPSNGESSKSNITGKSFRIFQRFRTCSNHN